LNKIFKYKLNFFLIFLFLISFYNSINQAIYNYDGFHWGLVLFSADGLNKNLIPYKEVFIHYGFLTTYINSIILKIFDNNFLYIFSLSSFLYAFSIFLIGILINKFSNQNLAMVGAITIFLIHPYAIYPWHTYYLFFIFNVFLFFRVSENFYYQQFSYLILSLIILFSESFFFPSLIILIFDCFLSLLKQGRFNLIFIKIIFSRIFFYILPFFFFFFYLITNQIFEEWKVYNQMGKVFFEILDMNLYSIFISFFATLSNKTIEKFFFEPQWIIFSFLIIFNIIYLSKFFSSLFFKKKNNYNYTLILISFSSLILLFQTLHSITIFKFSCGLVIGFIVLFSFINSIDDKEIKIISSSIILFLGLFSFELAKSNSNLTYVYKYKKEDHVKNNYFKYFKSQRLHQKNWNHLITTSQKIEELKLKCKVTYGANLSKDGLISVIMRDSIKVVHRIPWFEHKKGSWMNKYYNTFLKYFDVNLLKNINEQIDKDSIIIYTDRENFPTLFIANKKLDFSNKMNFESLPYSYQNKNKIIIFPKKCNNFIS